MAVHMFHAQHGHCEPTNGEGNYGYPGNFAFDAHMNRTHEHVARRDSVYGRGLTLLWYTFSRVAWRERGEGAGGEDAGGEDSGGDAVGSED